MKKMLDKAFQIASKAHQGQTDKAGEPYILHVMHVMNAVKHYQDYDLMIIALLHDVVEDSEMTIKNLFEHGFNSRVITAIAQLTIGPNELYVDYIKSMSENNDARRVKLADLKHNMDLTRLPEPLTDEDLKRIKKYHQAYNYLYNI